NLSQTTMRAEIGKLTLDSTFSERDTINSNIVSQVDLASDPWGIKVLRYEIKNITPSGSMIHTMEIQMEAERQRRAEVTLAEAEKQARINSSTADRQELINISEGDRQKKINEAEGTSQEIKLLANATAEGVKLISLAVSKPGGELALKMRIIDQFIEEFGKIVNRASLKVVPTQLANIKGFFEGLSHVSTTIPTTAAGPGAKVTSQKKGGGSYE
ncbi:MAG: SPFH/Band 7/PHB domain protein, partial [Proteobacteria bacterium]|nr:SPFH/Band 7/PHB domain protein [Pseudomonadota bacterium]